MRVYNLVGALARGLSRLSTDGCGCPRPQAPPVAVHIIETRVQGAGYRVHDIELGIQDLGVMIKGSVFRVYNSSFTIQDLGFRCSRFGV